MSAFADERTLEALDFAGVRERVVAATARSAADASRRQLAPAPSSRCVAREQARTDAARDLVAGADFHVLPRSIRRS